MVKVNTEMALYDAELARKPQIMVVNKIDIPAVRAREEEITRSFADIGTPVMFISAETGEGVPALVTEAVKMLGGAGVPEKITIKKSEAVFRPRPREEGVRVRIEGGIFVIDLPGLERILGRVDLSNPEVVRQLHRPMEKLGVRRALEKAGIRPGDRVRCGEFEWEW
jgi:GTP-binding protein